MLVTITSTGPSATDLGFLLHKHPGRVQGFDVSPGRAHVFYPEATPERTTAALLLEVDPIALVRGGLRHTPDGFSLAQYVNDRPYAASSMLAVALGKVFRTAMTGRCDARPELPGRPLPLSIRVPALPCAGGPEVARRVFGPLGWQVEATPVPLDPELPGWGDSRYVDLSLTGTVRLADALNHLYVLLPVLDGAKHYWVGTDEVDKLIRAGSGWLATHPDRDLITRRYLAHRRDLVLTAVGRLAEIDDTEPEALDNAVPGDPAAPMEDAATPVGDPAQPVGDRTQPVGDRTQPMDDPGPPVAAPEDRPVSLAAQRRDAVLTALRGVGATRVVDLGCGEGILIREILADPSFREVVGADVSHRALDIAARRLRLATLPTRQRERVHLIQSSAVYRDARLHGFDAIVLMEVIEHVDPSRLDALARAVFGDARPGTVLVTTPNVEYNVRFPTLPAGTMRHRDHRFEWTRADFRAWAAAVAGRYGYQVEYQPVGPDDPDVGPPTQMAVFGRLDGGGRGPGDGGRAHGGDQAQEDRR